MKPIGYINYFSVLYFLSNSVDRLYQVAALSNHLPVTALALSSGTYTLQQQIDNTVTIFSLEDIYWNLSGLRERLYCKLVSHWQ